MIYQSPQNIQTLETDWWFLFDLQSLTIITSPQQCGGYTSSPYSMFVGDSLAQCQEYIKNNGITKSLDAIEN